MLDGSDDACGEEDDGADELKYSTDGDAQDAERNQEQPDDGVGDEREQSQGPAEDEEDAEDKEFCHGGASIRARAPGLVCGEAFELNSL